MPFAFEQPHIGIAAGDDIQIRPVPTPLQKIARARNGTNHSSRSRRLFCAGSCGVFASWRDWKARQISIGHDVISQPMCGAVVALLRCISLPSTAHTSAAIPSIMRDGIRSIGLAMAVTRSHSAMACSMYDRSSTGNLRRLARSRRAPLHHPTTTPELVPGLEASSRKRTCLDFKSSKLPVTTTLFMVIPGSGLSRELILVRVLQRRHKRYPPPQPEYIAPAYRD